MNSASVDVNIVIVAETQAVFASRCENKKHFDLFDCFAGYRHKRDFKVCKKIKEQRSGVEYLTFDRHWLLSNAMMSTFRTC